MEKHVLEERIRTAVEHAAPDQMDQILSSCEKSDTTRDTPICQMHTEGRKKGVIHMKKAKKSGLAAIAAIAAVFVLCFSYLNLFPGNGSTQIDSVIILDVNPSISLSIDAQETVLSAEALNDEGSTVLGDLELSNTSLETAITSIVNTMLQEGYLGDLQNTVLVSVENQDTAHSEELREKISRLIDGAMQDGSTDAAILSQTVSADDAELIELAAQYNISLGKAALIQEVIALDPTLTFETLAPMTINEIALIVTSKNLSSDSVVQTGAASDKAYISQDEAMSLACAHAGVSAEDAQKLNVEFDSEDGIMVYEIEFKIGTTEYEYEIDASTGEILKYEMENKASTSATEGTTAGGNSDYIGETAAKEAALSHAGVSESETYFINCFIEYDDGQPECYGVKFAAGSTVYKYEIDLYSGTVLACYTDPYHHSNSSGSTSDSSSASYIGESAALNVALEHAGVAESGLTGLEVELDEDGNRMVYEIEFKVGHREYEYEIDASTGDILSFEID